RVNYINKSADIVIRVSVFDETCLSKVNYVRRKTGCPEKWTKFGSSCYFLSEESKSWNEAREFCRAKGADLVVINTEGENGTWKWVDGKDQPDDGGGMQAYGEEDCVQIRNIPGSWNDVACKTSQKWICEKEATSFV
uniref:C-type lectin domain-containing protein n=1 Tax=Oryzias latipes TaxID=8090 RepID=A0A3P9L190_ORYLA